MGQSDFGGEANPYGAPQARQPGQPVAGTRPASASVFGILNIVFGVMGLFGVAVTIIMWMMPANPRMPNPALELMREDGLYRSFVIVGTGIGSVASVALIAAGVGLLRFRPWARTLSIAYAVYAIISVIVGAVANYFLLLRPLMDNANNLPPGPEKVGAIAGAIGGVIGSGFGLIYPVVLLIFMVRLKLPATNATELHR